MSKEVVETIVLKAKAEPEFMKQLMENPEAILKDYNVTEKEIEFFKNADEKTLRGLSEKCFKLSDSK